VNTDIDGRCREVGKGNYPREVGDVDALHFVGVRLADGLCEVTADGLPLPERQDLRNHSPDGFEWGYGGSGPAQLALAMLALVAGDELALAYYQAFKHEVVSWLPREGWTIEGHMVGSWLLDRMERQDMS
jgi:hypothetical protein